MPALTVYEKPTCSTCRKVVALLRERGADFERVDYFQAPLTAQRLQELLDRAGLEPQDVLRTKEAAYSELGLAGGGRARAELIELLIERPELLQRPLVDRGDRVLLARPPERVLELLDPSGG